MEKGKVKKKFAFYAFFFVVVVVAFWFGIFYGTDNWKSKPAELNAVHPFSFQDQNGRNFTQQDLIGKVTVVEFFFTHCKGICPILNTNMRTKVYSEFKDNPNFQIMSNTCDPDRDSVPRLKYYSDSLQVNTNMWHFLTARKDSLYNAARISFMLDDPKNSVKNIDDQFLHTQFWAVIDKNGIVRGQIFDGLKSEEIKQMNELIQQLLKEKVGPTDKNFVVGG